MRALIILIYLTVFLNSCCSYDDKDFDFKESELRHFSSYKIGDTIYFESDKNDVDTITITGFDTESNRACGAMSFS